jgi:hypothetical protein
MNMQLRFSSVLNIIIFKLCFNYCFIINIIIIITIIIIISNSSSKSNYAVTTTTRIMKN